MAPALSDLQPQSAPKATAAAQTAIGDGLVAEAQAFADELAAWRHDLHQMPELGNSLPQTSTYIQARLTEMDIPFATLVDGSCVVGLVGAGAAAAQGNINAFAGHLLAFLRVPTPPSPTVCCRTRVLRSPLPCMSIASRRSAWCSTAARRSRACTVFVSRFRARAAMARAPRFASTPSRPACMCIWRSRSLSLAKCRRPRRSH